MGQDHPPTLLIVEDNFELAEMLSAYFDSRGCCTLTTALGERAASLAAESQPDLILLDIRLPDINGFEVCKRLRASHRTRHIPTIFLTERRLRADRLEGLQMGVVDYITKPFDIEELWLRVRNTLRRSAAARSSNPVTGLPDQDGVAGALASALAGERGEWGALAARLEGLHPFRERYGFIASDSVLRVVGMTLSAAAAEVCGEAAFCGHLQEDTFALIVPTVQLDPLQGRIAERLRGSLQYFYPNSEREPDGPDRLALALGRVTAREGPFASVDALRQALLAAQAGALIV